MREMLPSVVLVCLGIFAQASLGSTDKVYNDVAIEDFIDLDDEAPTLHLKSHGKKHTKGINHIIAPGGYSSSPSPSSYPPSPPSPSPTSMMFSSSSPVSVTPTRRSAKTNNVIFDDEDIFISGSGSGSGDFHPGSSTANYGENGRPTPTSKTSWTPETASVETSTPISGDTKMPRELPVSEDKVRKGPVEWLEDENRTPDDTEDLFVEDNDIMYDYPTEPQPIMSNHIITPAAWGPWSAWISAGKSSKVRVRSCQAKGREVSDTACEGVRLQVKSCDIHTGRCGKTKNITNQALNGCSQPYKNVPQDSFKKAPPPPPQVPDAPPPLELRPNPAECFYSLFDNFRQKFVFTRWNLTALITKSKVKRWCDKKSGQYLVMTTPLEHCRRYYKDLCKVTQRCRNSKSVTDAGDFAEGCWRNHVYGERLPVGLSNAQMKTFFICQRFAPSGRAGMTFGYKHTYFTTLYDINMRTPVISLVKLTSLGDDIWPETDYFVEHSLVEDDANMLWRYQKKPKKGMLTLGDLDRCQDDQSCDLGLRQVVPEDFQNSFPEDDQYIPAHLIWPDLMPSDPSHRLATFTLTNIAPMMKSLYKEWRSTVLKIRQFALDQCHIPYNFDLNVNHPGQQSTHRTHKSAMYLASGVIPNLDPVVTTGHDVHVPFLFWISGCCVQHHGQTPAPADSSNSTNQNTGDNMSWENDPARGGSKTNVSAFAVYISNAAGSGVIAAPVLQLEMILQDAYKVDQGLDDVKLFPGHNSVCNELKNDVSSWFQ